MSTVQRCSPSGADWTSWAIGLAAGVVTFTPTANFFGVAGFDYTISDGTSTDVGRVTVTVTAVDDLPVAVADVGFTDEDLGIFVDVLTNDTGLGDGGLTIAIATACCNGPNCWPAPVVSMPATAAPWTSR